MTTNPGIPSDDPAPPPSGRERAHAALAVTLDGARDLLGAVRVAVLLPSSSGELQGVARTGFSVAAVADLAVVLAGAGCSDRLRAGQSLTLALDDQVAEELRPWLTAHGERQVVVTPLGDMGAFSGVLALGFDGSSRLTAARLTAVERFAALVGIALAGARRHAAAERRPAGANDGAHEPADDREAVEDSRDAGHGDEPAQALVAERQRFISLINTLPEGLLIVQDDGQVSLYNQAAIDLLGRAPEELSFSRRWDIYRPRTADGRPIPLDELPVARAFRGETVRAFELTVCRADGSDMPLLISAGPVREADGRVGAAIMVFQDITPLKELDRLKDDFINTVSHELRTPTTTIRGGALTLLKRSDRLDVQTRRQLLQDIAEESERLHHLVEDLLSLSRSQAGMRMAPEPLRLHRLVNRVILDLGPRTGGRSLIVDVPAGLPVVEADPVALEQVLRNLIENALVHSDRSALVEVTADAIDGEVRISVLDRGPGIPPDDLERVFEPFYRLPETVHAGAQGAGLGLTVCRRLIEMHGGRIWADRRPGGGAAFRFTLTVARDEGDDAGDAMN